MTQWVLILAVLSGTSQPAATTAYFGTREECMEAGRAADMAMRSGDVSVRFACAPTSTGRAPQGARKG